MNIIQPNVEVITPLDGDAILKHIETCGRVCYKSEHKIEEGSAKGFVQRVINNKHEAVLEHYNITVRFICDRGVSHEIVRHRLASYCQESTRYCNYSKEQFGKQITFIAPSEIGPLTPEWDAWATACEEAENMYFTMLTAGATPQQARAVLPNSLKTEVIMTTNLREWRHFFRLRTSKAAHPDMRVVATMLLQIFKSAIPVVFDDIEAA